MLIYHKKNSYFVPEADAKLVPMGSYVLTDNGMIFVNDLNDVADATTSNANPFTATLLPKEAQVKWLDGELRIMCPKDIDWNFQNVGPTGDKNTQYFAFKAYAPNDNVVSFKEGDRGAVIDQMHTFDEDFSGIDERGKYSVCWLALARHANDVWTYYGAKSTTAKYIGWDYIIEWYNEAGEVVGTNKIRINLANEECF